MVIRVFAQTVLHQFEEDAFVTFSGNDAPSSDALLFSSVTLSELIFFMRLPRSCSPIIFFSG